MHKLIILLTTLLLAIGAGAQPYGSASRARTHAVRTDGDMKRPEVRLGYLGTGKVSQQLFLDNLEIGLVGAGFADSRVISFTVFVEGKAVDDRPASDVIKGAKIPRKVFEQYGLGSLPSGTRVYFDNIRLEYSRDAYRVMPPIVITIE